MSEGGHNMSNYGVKSPTIIETSGIWKQDIRHENQIHQNHLSYKGNGTDIWHGTKEAEDLLLKDVDQISTYCRQFKEHQHVHTFDRMFHISEGYNTKLHRDDREHTVGLDVLSEERKRPVPVLSSSQYGRHIDKPHEDPIRDYVRIERVQKGFYRSSGTGIPSSFSK